MNKTQLEKELNHLSNRIFKCEKCGKDHDGSYGSGRFCSNHCKQSWLTTLSNKSDKHKQIIKCNICGNEFIAGKHKKILLCDKCRKKTKSY